MWEWHNVQVEAPREKINHLLRLTRIPLEMLIAWQQDD